MTCLRQNQIQTYPTAQVLDPFLVDLFYSCRLGVSKFFTPIRASIILIMGWPPIGQGAGCIGLTSLLGFSWRQSNCQQEEVSAPVPSSYYRPRVFKRMPLFPALANTTLSRRNSKKVNQELSTRYYIYIYIPYHYKPCIPYLLPSSFITTNCCHALITRSFLKWRWYCTFAFFLLFIVAL